MPVLNQNWYNQSRDDKTIIILWSINTNIQLYEQSSSYYIAERTRLITRDMDYWILIWGILFDKLFNVYMTC